MAQRAAPALSAAGLLRDALERQLHQQVSAHCCQEPELVAQHHSLLTLLKT